MGNHGGLKEYVMGDSGMDGHAIAIEKLSDDFLDISDGTFLHFCAEKTCFIVDFEVFSQAFRYYCEQAPSTMSPVLEMRRPLCSSAASSST